MSFLFKSQTVVLLVLIFLSASAGNVTAAPKAVAAPARHDAGVFAVGETSQAALSIRNEGDEPLILSKLVLPRGLKLSKLDSPIAPGATGQLVVQIDTFAFAGPATVPISLTTNDPATPTLQLQLVFTIRAYVLAFPGFARYNTVQGEKEGTIVETLWADDATDFKLTSVESPFPHVRVVHRETAEKERDQRGKGRQWRIEITLATDAPVGALAGFVVANLDHPRQKKVYMPVTGFVRPAFAATPPSLTLGEIDLSKPATTSVVVKNYSEAESELLAASTDIPGVKAEIVSEQKGRAWRVRLIFTPEMREGACKGALTIQTANKKYPTIRVPISCDRLRRS